MAAPFPQRARPAGDYWNDRTSASSSRFGAEPDRILRGQARFHLGPGNRRSRGALVEPAGVQGHAGDGAHGARGSEARSWSSTSSASEGSGWPG